MTPSTIRVVDEQGDPIAGASVTPPIFAVAAGSSTMPGTLRVPLNRLRTTDASGAVTVDTYDGMVADPATPGVVVPPSGLGYEQEVEFTVTNVGGTTTVVVEQDLAHVDGTVLDADGDPVAGTSFAVAGGFETTTLGDGGFAIDVPVGTEGFTLVTADGSRFEATDPVFADDTTLPLRLPRRVRLNVDVSGDGGRPLAGANVNLVLLPGLRDRHRRRTAGDAPPLRARNVTTDAAGAAVFAGLPRQQRVFGPEGSPSADPRGRATSRRDRRCRVRRRRDGHGETAETGDDAAVDRLRPDARPGRRRRRVVVGRESRAGGHRERRRRGHVADVRRRRHGEKSRADENGDLARRHRQRQRRGPPPRRVQIGRRAGQPRGGRAPVGIDRHRPLRPVIAIDRPADSANGWWRDLVWVSVVDAGDPPLADGSAGSGVDPDSIPSPTAYYTSDRVAVSATVSDRAGNVSAVRRATVKVDADAPTSTLTCPAAPVRAGRSRARELARRRRPVGPGGPEQRQSAARHRDPRQTHRRARRGRSRRPRDDEQLHVRGRLTADGNPGARALRSRATEGTTKGTGMGRRFTLLLAAAVTIVLALASAAQAGTLSGRVTGQTGGTPGGPVAGATVAVETRPGRSSRRPRPTRWAATSCCSPTARTTSRSAPPATAIRCAERSRSTARLSST